MVLEVASRCLSVCPFPPFVVTLTSLLPTLSSLLFRIHSSAISSLSLPSNSIEKTNQPGPSCAACYTYCPAGIHCFQLVTRHVFDSMRTCILAKCEHTSEHKHIFLHILRSAKKSVKTVKGHRSGQV